MRPQASRIKNAMFQGLTDQGYLLLNNGGPVNLHGYQLRETAGNDNGLIQFLTQAAPTAAMQSAGLGYQKIVLRTDTGCTITNNSANFSDTHTVAADVGTQVLGVGGLDLPTVLSNTPGTGGVLSATYTGSTKSGTASLTFIETQQNLVEFDGETITKSSISNGGISIPNEGVWIPGGILVVVYTAGTSLTGSVFWS